METRVQIAVASPAIISSLEEGLQQLEQLVAEAAAQQAVVICFPESYLPGYPGMGYPEADRTPERLQEALQRVQSVAAAHHIAVIVPMDWHLPGGLHNLAFVISATGEILGYQTKNQLDPSEDEIWVPGTERSVFNINGLLVGITICHEGFRYPESVRWAAQHGAQVVFHPHFGGSNTTGIVPDGWADNNNVYYEKAQMMRALENTVYFATSNFASRFPESASAVIAPDGSVVAHAPYTVPGVTVAAIDTALATGFLAKRFKAYLYR